MIRDHNDESNGVTRREALLAAGAGGLSMMGFCSACEAGEVKMTYGAGTPPKNISRLSPDNPIIQQIEKAASVFKNRDFSRVQVSRDDVVSRIQELFHQGEAARKLGRKRSVVRVSGAAVADSDKERVLKHFASEGFASSDLEGAQLYFTRSSLLDPDKIRNVKDLPVSNLAAELPGLDNTNLNTLTAISFDSKANVLKLNIVLNAGRGAIQLAFNNFAVSPKRAKELPPQFIDPPPLKDPDFINRVRLTGKIIRLPAPSSSSSGSSGSSDSKSGDSSGSGSTDAAANTRAQCWVDCLGALDGNALAAIGLFCGACAAVIGVAAISDAASAGLATPVGVAAILVACNGCYVTAGALLIACILACGV